MSSKWYHPTLDECPWVPAVLEERARAAALRAKWQFVIYMDDSPLLLPDWLLQQYEATGDTAWLVLGCRLCS